MLDLFFAPALAEETAAPTTPPTWFQTTFEKFGEISVVNWIALGVLVLLGIGLLVVSRQNTKWTPKMLAYAALAIALSFVLSYIRLAKMLQGGSITPASMLPLMLFAAAYGVGPGLVAGAAYGLLQFIQDSWMLNIWQFLLDYPIGFGMIGLTALFSKKGKSLGLYAGIFVASLCRFIASTLSGVVFFADYAPEGMSPLLYSIGYNGSYMLPEMIICIILAIFVAPRILPQMKK